MRRTGVDRVEHVRAVRGWSLAVGVAMCAGLIGGLVSPVWASSGGGSHEVEVGSFALGDALEGTIGELDGSFGFTLQVAGLPLAWDSRAVAANPVAFGDGWSLGLATLRVSGGVWVVPASGEAYAMDAASPTGLAGYPRSDVRFEEAAPGALLPGGGAGPGQETAYAYVLHELGGVSTYFDSSGNPLARIMVGGERMEWQWEAGATGRLLSVRSADGAVTALDWSDPGRVVIVPGSNVTKPVEGSGVGGRWVVELDGGRVSAVIDPVGARTDIGYDRQGLVQRVATPSGAATVVEWQASPDGVARVDRVRLIDAETAAELSVRHWAMQGQVTPSGWPLEAEPNSARTGGASTAGGPAYETSLTDGKTRVTSSVDLDGRMTDRAVVVSSSAGERMMQAQAFEYPEGSGAPGGNTQPIAATTTYHDERGGTRSASETYAFDELNRMVSRTAIDGAVMRWAYDDEIATGRRLPVGLVVEETTTTADGLVTTTRSELSEDRSAVVVAEQWSGRTDRELVRTGRVETDVEQGFVTEERVYPGADPDAVPVVTRWSRQLDLVRGTKATVQTVAAGTAREVSSRSESSLVHGATLTETDEVGNTTSARYDDAGRQISVEDAAGRRVVHEYRTRQANGVNAITITDVTGVAVTETQDVVGRVVAKSDNIAPSGRAAEGYERVFETREYDTPGVERVIDAWGAVTTTEQDVFGRTKRVTLPNGVVQLGEYDDVAGTATSGLSTTGDLADAESATTSVLDATGQVTGTTGRRADGAEVPATSTAYDGFGREVRSTDGRRSTSTEYDAFGNPVAFNVQPAEGAAGAGVTAAREYDGFGVSVEKTLRSESESYSGQRRELDEFGRVTLQIDQRGSAERTAYTSDGLIAEIVSDTGQRLAYAYDPHTRDLVAARVSSPGTTDVVTAFRYDTAGRVSAVFDPADERGTAITYEHDDFGNVTRTVYPDGAEIRHEYDAHGRKTATIDTAENRTDYTSDEAGALVAAIQTDRAGTPVSGVRYGHDDYARVNLIERENGVRTEYTFTSAAEIQSEVTTAPDGVLSERTYAYAPTGTLSSRIDRTRGDTGALQATRTDYEYDAHDRLIRSELRHGDGPYGPVLTRTEYVPTIGGDLRSETVTTNPERADAVASTRRFEYSEVGELTAVITDGQRLEQTFDQHGNLLTATAGARYQYDAAGRPIEQTGADGVEVTTSYWADGSRREHRTATGSTAYYWDGATLLNEYHDPSTGEPGTASYLIGTTRHARSIRPEHQTSSTSYFGADRHGNITDLTDQAGAATIRYTYTDYGITTTIGDRSQPMPAGIGELGYNPYQYAGEYSSRDGTQLLGPRIYDPVQTRFLTQDEAPLANLYAFGDLNPITNVDPTGRASEEDARHIGLLIGGFIAAVVGSALFLTTPGGLFTAFGMIGFAVSTGDAVLAGLHIVEAYVEPATFDDQAIEIASWSFFTASILTGLGGVAGKFAKRVKATCTELLDCASGGAKSTSSSSRRSSSSGSDDDLLAKANTRDAPKRELDAKTAHMKVEQWNEWLSNIKVETFPNVVEQVGSPAVNAYLQRAKLSLVAARGVAANQLSTAGTFLQGVEHGAAEAIVVTEKWLRRTLKSARNNLQRAEDYLAGMVEAGHVAASTALPKVVAMRRQVAVLVSEDGVTSSPGLRRQF
jgi:RHS repeat-associated protein